MRKILFPLLLILLLTSCSERTESIGIWSEEGAVIYSNKDDGGKIVIEKELMSSLLEAGNGIEDIFSGTELYQLSSSEWRQRNIVLSSLLSVTGESSVEKVYEKENKILAKSSWGEKMNEISKGFEDRLLAYVKKNGGDYHLYSAENAIDGILLEGNEERIRVFLKKWIKAIVG